MGTIREGVSRLFGFLRRRDAARSLDDELDFHQEMLERDLQQRGLPPGAAHREARLRFGGRRQIQEAWADQASLPLLESILQDIRYACRTLLRSPAFTAVAAITLALGIGASTAVFSVVHATLLRPLPYPDPDRLVMWGDRQPDGVPGNLGFLTFQDVRDRSQVFESVAVVRSWSPTLVVDGQAERVRAIRVSSNFFAMLGVAPAIGRSFREDEDAPDRWRVLVISDGLWRRRFGGDPDVVGRVIRMNDREYAIVGVMPPGFEPLISGRFYQPADMWAPVGYDGTLPDACRSCQHLKAFGRLRPGVTVEQAAADLDAVRDQLEAEYPSEYPAGAIEVRRLQDAIAGPVRTVLLVLMGAVAFVLLIACANVANLTVARAANRSREMFVRASLGAGPGRIARQLLTESLVLGLAGGALGVALAVALVRSLSARAPMTVSVAEQPSLDPTVLAFALALSLLTGLGFGLVPAVRGGSGRTVPPDSRAVVGGLDRVRKVLVVADLAIALVLLAGAGLMLETVARLMSVNPGFNPSGVLTLQFSLVGEAYREDAAVLRFQNRLLEEVKALPGVEAAALTGQIPLGGNHDTWGFHVEGRSRPNPAEDPSVERYSVSPGYFDLLQIPLKRGRLFTDADDATAPPVVVVSETTARSLWPGEDPVGARVRVGGARAPFRSVVGIVGDVHHYQLGESALPQMYLPQSQITDSFLVLAVRTDPSSVAALPRVIRSVVRSMDPAVPVYDVSPLSDLVRRSYAAREFVLVLLSGFAIVALLLAAVGLYGVISYTVSQRTREVGLRVALGARPSDIRRMVFGEGVPVVAVGLTAGLAFALVLTRYLESLLYGVRAADPVAHALAVLVLALVAAGAHVGPVRRALRVDPAVALRHD
jgi:putative ABC transport system permease protein